MAKTLEKVVDTKNQKPAPREVPEYLEKMTEESESKSLHELGGEALANATEDQAFADRAFADGYEYSEDPIPDFI